MHLLDVPVTQHANWTTKRVRRGLFGQSLVDFSTPSWSSIQLEKSTNGTESKPIEKQTKKTPRLLRSFAQARVIEEKEKSQTDEKQSFVPGMALYDSQSQDVDMISDAGTAVGSPGRESFSFSTLTTSPSKNGGVILSTSAVNLESTNNNLDFLPASK